MLLLMMMMTTTTTCFHIFNWFPSVPYIVSRTDRRQVSGEICWMFGSATVGFPSDKSGTSAGEPLGKPMVRLKGWKGESWYTSLFHHAGYCLRLENSYLPFAINLPGIDIDWCSTYLLNDPWWLENNSLPILSTSEYSKIVLGRGSSYDEEYNITHVHVELGFCRKCVLMKQHNFIRRVSIIRESWHETIDGRSRFKLIPLPTKQKQNQVDQFLLYQVCQVFLCFCSSPFGLWTRSPRPDLRPEARFAPKQDVSSDASAGGELGGWCFSSDIAHNTTRFHDLCILWRIFKSAWTIHRNCPPSALSPWSYILFQKNLQMWTASSCSYFTIPTRDSQNHRYIILFSP